MSTKPFRVALVDDHIAFLDHSSAMLNAHSGFEVITKTLDGQEAIISVPELKPDVAVIDVAMPELNGFATALRLLRNLPELKVFMVSEVEDEHYITLAKDVGAIAFIPKDKLSADELFKLVTSS